MSKKWDVTGRTSIRDSALSPFEKGPAICSNTARVNCARLPSKGVRFRSNVFGRAWNNHSEYILLLQGTTPYLTLTSVTNTSPVLWMLHNESQTVQQWKLLFPKSVVYFEFEEGGRMADPTSCNTDPGCIYLQWLLRLMPTTNTSIKNGIWFHEYPSELQYSINFVLHPCQRGSQETGLNKLCRNIFLHSFKAQLYLNTILREILL